MSDDEVISLVDTALLLPVTEATNSELRLYRLQAEAGQLEPVDRNYVIALCNRLLRRTSDETPKLSNTREQEEAEAKQKRITGHRQAGRLFDSVRDLKWLYFDLALKGEFENWSSTESDLRNLILGPTLESSWEKGSVNRLTEQAVQYIENPVFHCTALRDFFIVRLVESLTSGIKDPKKDRLVAFGRIILVLFLLFLALALYTFVNWWAPALVLFLLGAKVWGWCRGIEDMHQCKIRNQCTREKINDIVATLKRGGYDEPTIIRQVEIFDANIPPLPKLVSIYGCPYFLGSDLSGIQEHTIAIPDVLYALLRLPRRNIESEITKAVFQINDRKRDDITHRWRKFVDRLLTYDEPRSDPKYQVQRN